MLRGVKLLKIFPHALLGLTLTMLVAFTDGASAIHHGCTPPKGVKVITIDINLGGKKSRTRGTFCKAIKRAEVMIARRNVPERQKKAAYASLAQLQTLVVRKGRSTAAGRRNKIKIKNCHNCAIIIQVNK